MKRNKKVKSSASVKKQDKQIFEITKELEEIRFTTRPGMVYENTLQDILILNGALLTIKVTLGGK